MADAAGKTVRLDDEYARRLARLAGKLGTTQTEVVRRGIDLVEGMMKRHAAFDGLVELATIKGPEKESYRFR